jgi:hypothetical protein
MDPPFRREFSHAHSKLVLYIYIYSRAWVFPMVNHNHTKILVRCSIELMNGYVRTVAKYIVNGCNDWLAPSYDTTSIDMSLLFIDTEYCLTWHILFFLKWWWWYLVEWKGVVRSRMVWKLQSGNVLCALLSRYGSRLVCLLYMRKSVVPYWSIVYSEWLYIYIHVYARRVRKKKRANGKYDGGNDACTAVASSYHISRLGRRRHLYCVL